MLFLSKQSFHPLPSKIVSIGTVKIANKFGHLSKRTDGALHLFILTTLPSGADKQLALKQKSKINNNTAEYTPKLINIGDFTK